MFVPTQSESQIGLSYLLSSVSARGARPFQHLARSKTVRRDFGTDNKVGGIPALLRCCAGSRDQWQLITMPSRGSTLSTT